MVWADIPLTDEIRDAVRATFDLDLPGPAVRLHGGEESASYRLSGHVIRIGPDWRDDRELEWCYGLAAHAATGVPEVVAPLVSAEGSRVVRTDGRPVTVWPYVEGAWPEDKGAHIGGAADLLARVHTALGTAAAGPRPADSSPRVATPDLDDPELDAAVTAFRRSHHPSQALHGDYYRGNVLAHGGRLVGLVDWDNAFVGPREEEIAWAAWEWTDASDTFELSSCRYYVEAYAEAAGATIDLVEREIALVVRLRLRWEIAYGRAARERGIAHDADDLEYEADSIEAFRELKRYA